MELTLLLLPLNDLISAHQALTFERFEEQLDKLGTVKNELVSEILDCESFNALEHVLNNGDPRDIAERISTAEAHKKAILVIDKAIATVHQQRNATTAPLADLASGIRNITHRLLDSKQFIVAFIQSNPHDPPPRQELITFNANKQSLISKFALLRDYLGNVVEIEAILKEIDYVGMPQTMGDIS